MSTVNNTPEKFLEHVSTLTDDFQRHARFGLTRLIVTAGNLEGPMLGMRYSLFQRYALVARFRHKARADAMRRILFGVEASQFKPLLDYRIARAF